MRERKTELEYAFPRTVPVMAGYLVLGAADEEFAALVGSRAPEFRMPLPQGRDCQRRRTLQSPCRSPGSQDCQYVHPSSRHGMVLPQASP